jgi:hypothetical protein
VHNLPPMRPGNSLTWILRAVGVLAALAPLSLSGCGSDTDDRPAQFSYIYPAIIEPSCATASCHSNYTREAGVNFGLDSDEAYYQLIARHFVTPSDPADSELIYLLKAQGARRMPPDFALPEVDIDLISTWITAGAAQN